MTSPPPPTVARRRSPPPGIAVLVLALACLDAHATQRAFVSSAGNDANQAAGCTPAAPCRSFQAAHGAVDAGGEIVALDTAGYGPVAIAKSVSILGAPGVVASISVATGNGIAIATGGVRVVLRNLNINGLGGLNGIEMTAGDALSIENCVVSGFANHGIFVSAAARVRIVNTVVRRNDTGAVITGNASAEIVGSRFMGNNHPGLFVTAAPTGLTSASVVDSVSSGNEHGFVVGTSGGTGSADLSVTRSTAANNSATGFQVQGLAAGTTARLTVGSSMATGNGTGFNNVPAGGTATLESLGDNIVRGNTAASGGTITAVPSL